MSLTMSAPAEGAVITTDADLVYFSSISGNTHRFAEKVGRRAARLPVYGKDPQLEATAPYVLMLPTYGGGESGGAVPKQVIAFLNRQDNRHLIRGVIAAGNTNFGEAYCLAGDIVAAKCGVPLLYRFELFGTSDDVAAVQQGLDEFWKQH